MNDVTNTNVGASDRKEGTMPAKSSPAEEATPQRANIRARTSSLDESFPPRAANVLSPTSLFYARTFETTDSDGADTASLEMETTSHDPRSKNPQQDSRFHLDDSWIVRGPEEEVVFGNHSDDSVSFATTLWSCDGSDDSDSDDDDENDNDDGSSTTTRHDLETVGVLSTGTNLREQEQDPFEGKRKWRHPAEENEARTATKVHDEIENVPTEEALPDEKSNRERRQHESQQRDLKDQVRRLRQAEAQALEAKIRKQAEEEVERLQREAAEAQLLEPKKWNEAEEDERNERVAEALKLVDVARKQRSAEAESFEARKQQQAEESTRPEAAEAKNADSRYELYRDSSSITAEKIRLQDAQERRQLLKALKAKKATKVEERRQHEAKAKMLEERRRLIFEVKALEAKKAKEERKTMEAKAKAAEFEAKRAEDERIRMEARARAVEHEATIAMDEARRMEAQAQAAQHEATRATEERKIMEAKAKVAEFEAKKAEEERKRTEVETRALETALEATKSEEQRNQIATSHVERTLQIQKDTPKKNTAPKNFCSTITKVGKMMVGVFGTLTIGMLGNLAYRALANYKAFGTRNQPLRVKLRTSPDILHLALFIV